MSLIKKISQIFSSDKSSQYLGIAFQQKGLSLCSIPKKINDKTAKTIFQHEKANVTSYAKTISKLQADEKLEGLATLVLNEAQSQIVQVDKPSIPDSEIHSALKWQIKDLVTIAPNNMVLDYYDAPKLTTGNDRINVVCAPLDEVKKLVLATEEGKIKVEAIITQEFAFANLLPYQNDANLLVCQQPGEEIVLIIIKQQQVFFHRRLRGFTQLANIATGELSAQIIDDLSLEIQRSTDYFERQLKQAPIKAIKILLPIELEESFAEKLAENTTAPVSLLPLPSPYHHNREFAAVIGATIGNETPFESEIDDAKGESNDD